MDHKRVIVLCGHYGSGKTNIALHIAKQIKSSGCDVAIADLDIVNPYFRTKDSAEELKKAGITLICSDYAGTNVDIPALPGEIYSLTEDRSRYAVLDIGGDERGALALGRLAPEIVKENNYEMLAVVNMCRPLTRDAASAVSVLREIEYACKIPFTGIINNTNLGRDTTPDIVTDSEKYVSEISKIMQIPVVMTTVCENVFDELKNKIPNLEKIDLQKKIFEEGE
ncbi:MAG: hypothetical protein J5922_03035 [Clostridia bacterium]|nr:hypothetical protein [Clostridia bacterium]